MTGLEPAASGVTGQRSNQLSYTPNPIITGATDVHEESYRLRLRMACVKPNGCPTQQPAHVLHKVNQSEDKWKKMVGGDGIEPPTLSV